MDIIDNIRFCISAFVLSLIVIAIISFAANYDPPVVECVPVEAIVIDVYSQRMVPAGKVIIPAKYIVYFQYDDVKGDWHTSRQNFDFYKNNIGCTIDCFLTIKTFSDGVVTKELTAIADN